MSTGQSAQMPPNLSGRDFLQLKHMKIDFLLGLRYNYISKYLGGYIDNLHRLTPAK